ncbi:MAG: collagen-binding domain-containing protein [Clostridium sp.]|uniref:collagen-binding domain-containing protein n=1 Tax=Clostridium sp. TaxID=1506 RepID=UPI003F40C72D
MKRSLKRFLACIVTFVFVSFNVFSITGNAVTEGSNSKLGELSHFNGVIFNNATVRNSRVEGALAVGSNIELNTKNTDNFGICASANKGAESTLIGEEYINDNEPALLLGGNVINNTTQNKNNLQVLADPIIVGNNASSDTIDALKNTYGSKEIKKISNDKINAQFEQFRSTANSFIGDIRNIKVDSNKKDTFKYHGDNGSSYYQNADVNEVSNNKGDSLYCKLPYNGSNTLNISEIHLPDLIGSAKDNNVKYLIMYSDATTVNFNGGGTFYNSNYAVSQSDIGNGMILANPKNDTLKRLASKIIWVLPNAKTIKSDGEIIGSIMAPNATLNTDGGDIIGQVVINNFNQQNGGNFCNAIFDWNNLDVNNGNNTNSNDILNINKTADYTYKDSNELNNREYNIKLEASVKKNIIDDEKPKDIMLVLDTSGSMMDNNGVAAKNLVSSAKGFSKKILENSKNKIATVAFSAISPYVTDMDYYYYKNGKRFYKGNINYYGKSDNTEVLIDPATYRRNYYGYEYYTGYINYGQNNQKQVVIEKSYDKYNRWVLRIVSGIPEDAEILNGFTNNLSDITNKLDKISFGGGTDTQASIGKIDQLLQTTKGDTDRDKYVIFFTDGMPNVVESGQILSMNQCVDETIKSFNKLADQNKDTKFVSLGFKSSTLQVDGNSDLAKKTEELLKAIGRDNSNIDPSCKNGVIYIDKPEDIGKVYDEIYNKISTNVKDAKIVDTVPDNFEIIAGSESPKGAVINGNTITWDNQFVGGDNVEYTFKVRAKDTFVGNSMNDSNYMNEKGQVPTNTQATIEYTNPIKSNKVVQEFPIPKVNVPNLCTLNLKNETVLYGDKIKLSELINNLVVKYGPKDGYKYTWTDDKGNKIDLNNQTKNDKSGNNFDANSKEYGITMKEDTNYTLEITNDNIPNFNLKSTGKVTVIKPEIQVTKKVVDEDGNSVNSDGLFSFNLSQKYSGDNHVEITKQEWNTDIKENSTFTMKNIVRGIYTFRERDNQGYNLKSMKVNGENVDINNVKFEVSLNNGKLTINNKVVNDKKPVINIEITNIKNNIDFQNSTNVITNNFDKC